MVIVQTNCIEDMLKLSYDFAKYGLKVEFKTNNGRKIRDSSVLVTRIISFVVWNLVVEF